MPERAITRDIEWGVEVPVDDLGPGKRIYVWFDAVIGYLSAAKEWAQRTGDPEAWRMWWEDPEAESYYFVGKDNIPFHTVIWPAMLLGYGGLNLPTDVPANQYITFKGAKASKSKGVGRSIGWYAERLQPDALRYAIASVLPEQNDTDLSDDEIIRRINDELVATWGNLVNRVLSLTSANFDGKVPNPDELTGEDQTLLASVDEALLAVASHIEAVELRAGLRAAMDAATEVNVYLNANAPWKVVKEDPKRAETILWTAIQAIAGIRVALSPYLPFTTPKVGANARGLGRGRQLATPIGGARNRPGSGRAAVSETGQRRPGLIETQGSSPGSNQGESRSTQVPGRGYVSTHDAGSQCRGWLHPDRRRRCDAGAPRPRSAHDLRRADPARLRIPLGSPHRRLAPRPRPDRSSIAAPSRKAIRRAGRPPSPWPSRSARRCLRSRRSARSASSRPRGRPTSWRRRPDGSPSRRDHRGWGTARDARR